MKRRNFLRMSAAALVGSATLPLAWVPRAGAATVTRTLYLTEGFITQITGEDIYFRSFSSDAAALQIPGAHFIVQAGDTVEVTLINTLSTSHSFVIDGIVDSGPIAPGQTVTVSFTPDTAGTYLYYDNLDAPYNRLSGLHGGFAVMPAGSTNELYPGSLTFTQQLFWIFNQIDPVWHADFALEQQPTTEFDPHYFTINGLGGRPPGAPGNHDPLLDAMYAPGTAVHGHVGEPALLRCLNPGLCSHAVHTHANHMQWLTSNGQIRPHIWSKDIVPLDGDMGSVDVIFPFDPPPDAWPPVTTGAFPMHLHDEMSQTAGGGFYMFGALTDIFFE